MKNYAAILLTTILSLTIFTLFGTAQEPADSYFAGQVRLSKTGGEQARPSVAENATAPANDNFAAAETVTLNQSGLAALTGNTLEASEEASEPDHAENPGGRSVWFKFTPTATKAFEIRTNMPETDFDSLLAVYKGDALQNLTRVGHNDDCFNNCIGGTSRVRLLLQAGTTYYIAVDGHNNGGGVSTGNFKLLFEEYNQPFGYDNLFGAYNLNVADAGSIAGTNHLATLQQDEPGAYVDPGGKSVWYRFQTTRRRAMTFELSADFIGEMAVYQSSVADPTFAQLDRLDENRHGFSFNYGKYAVNFAAYPGQYYFIQIDHYHEDEAPVSTGNFQLKFYQTKFRHSMRVGGSSPANSLTLFRPSDNVWYTQPSFSLPVPRYKKFGLSGDTPVPADFDGDALTNYAVTRNTNGLKHWYILQQDSETQYHSFQWGLASDKPITGDFDRDGLADACVIRNQNGTLVWYVRQSSDLTLRTFVFGITGDKPVLGDFDNDGATDVAVTRLVDGDIFWHVLKSGYLTSVASTYSEYEVAQFGSGSDSPAAEDFDGDGRADYAVFRQTSGTWRIVRSSTGQIQETQFGQLLDKPQPADYDGDGKADLAVYRPSNGTWYFWLSFSNTNQVVKWGGASDVPVSSMNTLSQ